MANGFGEFSAIAQSGVPERLRAGWVCEPHGLSRRSLLHLGATALTALVAASCASEPSAEPTGEQSGDVPAGEFDVVVVGRASVSGYQGLTSRAVAPEARGR